MISGDLPLSPLMNTQLAIYELAALVLAVPLSYALAWLVKQWAERVNQYQENLDRLYFNYWNGSPEDELNAWYKVRQTIKRHNPREKELKYIDKKIDRLNRNDFVSNSFITRDGDLTLEEIHKREHDKPFRDQE